MQRKPTKPKAGFKKPGPKTFKPPKIESLPEEMRLNRYVAQSGICSRRKAVDLVKAGQVKVNGEIILEPGYIVQPDDVVSYQGKDIKPDSKKIYILLNKPTDPITTLSDEKGRKTVMDIVGRTIKERIFPVGRLDRETTGLLLLTNDGDLAQKLSHPSFKVKKFYHVTLDRPLLQNDLEAIKKGVELEDGVISVEGVDYIEEKPKNEIGIEIHVGKNRIVRRIFEHLGYTVERLDRTYYAGLTKKDLPRSHYRVLNEREIVMLKHFT